MNNKPHWTLMPPIRHCLIIIVVIGFLQSLATAQTVDPGTDLYVVEDTSYFDFSFMPIPADLFFPGSDPFAGAINLGPDFVIPYIEPIDVEIKRISTADLPSNGSSDTVEIELVELSLKSINPLAITFGGNIDSFFDVFIELDPIKPPPSGQMQIQRTNNNGGTYQIPIEIFPLELESPVIRFLEVGNPANEIQLDIVDLLGAPLLLGTAFSGSWEFNPTHNQLVIPGVTGPDFYPFGPVILEGDGLHLELYPAKTIPEPAALLLALLGLALLPRRRRR